MPAGDGDGGAGSIEGCDIDFAISAISSEVKNSIEVLLEAELEIGAGVCGDRLGFHRVRREGYNGKRSNCHEKAESDTRSNFHSQDV